MEYTMNREQSVELDKIILLSIENEGQPYSVEDIQEELFKDRDYSYCLNLFYILNNHNPSLLYPINGPEPELFWVNDYAKAFIHNGGFKTLYDNEFKRKSEQDVIDALKLEKLTAEVDIVHFQKGLGKKLTIWGFVIAIISVTASILTTIISNTNLLKDKQTQTQIDTTAIKTQIQGIEKRLQQLEIKAKNNP